MLLALALISCSDYALKQPEGVNAAGPDVVVTPPEIVFPGVALGTPQTQRITIENQGNATLLLDTPLITGAQDFTIDALPADTVEPGEQLQLSVSFTPSSTSAQATLTVLSNDPDTPEWPVPLSGTGLVGWLVIEPDPIDFGAVSAGSSGVQTATLSNQGLAPIDVSELTVRGQGFSLVDEFEPLSLDPAGSATVDLAFAPLTGDTHEGVLMASSTDQARTHAVALTGDVIEPYDDPCWDTLVGYQTNPEARFVLGQGGDPVVVEYTGSEAGYTSELWLSFPTSLYLLTNHDAHTGMTIDLGSYDPDTELIFAIHVLDTGDWFYTGPRERSEDGAIHAAITYEGGCSWVLGFEDEYGGGDADYDDVTMRLSSDSLTQSL